MVPAMPGALSAVGILLADAVRDFSRTVMLQVTEFDGEVLARLEKEFAEMEGRAARGVKTHEAPVFERSLDVRYRGQGYELNVPWSDDVAEAFHPLHQRRYGFCNRELGLEVVTARVRARVAAEAYAPAKMEMQEGSGETAFITERDVYFEGAWVRTKIYARERLRAGDVLQGPALVTEYTSVTVLPPGARLVVDSLQNLMIEVQV
jgi:N-methylhydantoinase A